MVFSDYWFTLLLGQIWFSSCPTVVVVRVKYKEQ